MIIWVAFSYDVTESFAVFLTWEELNKFAIASFGTPVQAGTGISGVWFLGVPVANTIHASKSSSADWQWFCSDISWNKDFFLRREVICSFVITGRKTKTFVKLWWITFRNSLEESIVDCLIANRCSAQFVTFVSDNPVTSSLVALVSFIIVSLRLGRSHACKEILELWVTADLFCAVRWVIFAFLDVDWIQELFCWWIFSLEWFLAAS